MHFDLGGKSAFISGATGHLGTAMALALAEAGAHVFLNSRTRTSCEALSKRLRSQGLKATAAPYDITGKTAADDFFDGFNRPLDILINNAYFGRGGTTEVASAEEYRASYEVTVVSAQNLITAALPRLRQGVADGGYASIINIASMYALVSPDIRNYADPKSANPPFYGAAKAALLQFTRYAACEFGKEGIRVNAVAPGPFPAPGVCSSDPDFVARLASRVPLSRVGRAEEIGGPIVFLASPASSFVNGATLVVDGGWTVW